MLDHILGDNPSVEQQLAIIANSLSAHIINQREANEERRQSIRELTSEIGALKLLQREQNGNVAKAMTRIGQIEEKLIIHDNHHGLNDEKIGQRIGDLEQEQDNRIRFWNLLKVEWNIVIIATGFGLALGKFLDSIGFFKLIGLE